MRKIILILIFSLLLGCISEENSIETTKEKTSIAWVYNIEEAEGIAKEENKLIFIDFNADNCGWCRKLEEITYREENVIKLVNENFVPVYFDLDIEANKEIYVQKYHKYVQGYLPTILILDKEGKPLYRITGYKTDEQLIELLNKVLLEV